MAYAASQELKQIKTRTSEGKASAKSRGVKFGRKRTFTKSQVATIMEMRSKQGHGYGNIAKAMGMTKSTVRRIILENEN